MVTAAPFIKWLKDSDGDGKADADQSEVLYEGFAALNPQLRVSHFIEFSFAVNASLTKGA